ncbi:MAG TPA: DUF4440 domain-containing protein [Parafilimonas sp.]|nr:DUF4440 domain-containing protein [Parafilimonas sp.]
MKRIALVFCLAVVWRPLVAQVDDKIAINNVMNEQIDAWNTGNIDAFMHTYWQSDSLLFVSNPPIYGWQKTLDRYKKNYPDTAAMGKLSFDLLELKQLSAEYYFVMGKWHLKRTAGDAGGIFTLLFRKINGKWLIVVDHSN